jgi:protein SCO1/2
MKTLGRGALAAAVLAIGLVAGVSISRALLGAKAKGEAPVAKLSEIAAHPDAAPARDRASRLPIGLSPVPVEPPGMPAASAGETGHGPSGPIPWAPPYPAHPFTLTDQDGRAVSLRDFLGKVVLVNFIYTTCKTTCPLLTDELGKLGQSLGATMGRDVVFLSVTLDPGRDTPEKLKRYGQSRGVDFRSWKFLTGREETIRKVLDAYHVAVQVETPPGTPAGGYELGHGNPVYLIDQWGRVRKRTAPTMLVQIGRPAIEHLVREGLRH